LVSINVIDTHCHLLPGIDDGPRTLEETLRMCLIAFDDGIRTIVATPHTFDGLYTNRLETVRELCSRVNESLLETGMRLTILPGMEVRTSPELIEQVVNLNAPTINGGRYILVELHPAEFPAGFDVFVRLSSEKGYGIVLAHPEKNLAIQQDTERLFSLLSQFTSGELLVQITADSVTGRGGHSAKKTCQVLLEHNMVHLMASDAHDGQARRPIMSDAVREAARIVGLKRSEMMINSVPHAIISGGDLPELAIPQKPRRSWLRSLRWRY